MSSGEAPPGGYASSMKLRALSVVAGVALIVAACGSTEGDGVTVFPTDPDSGSFPDGVAPPPAPGACSPACVAPERCSSKGRCLSGAACDDTLDCEKGKVCDPKTLTCVPGGGCGSQAISAEPVPPNLLVVLDRSCSMTNKVGAQTKWEIAVDALKTLTTSYNGKIRFGLTMFPDTDANSCTQAAALPVPVGPTNETKIQTMLTSALKAADPNFPDGPCVTNIDTGMTQAATDPGFSDTTRKSFAMLVSDGAQAGCNAAGGDSGTTAAITALGIRNVGEATAKDLARHFGDLAALMAADVEALQRVHDVGPVVAESIAGFFVEAHNLEVIARLEQAGVRGRRYSEPRARRSSPRESNQWPASRYPPPAPSDRSTASRTAGTAGVRFSLDRMRFTGSRRTRRFARRILATEGESAMKTARILVMALLVGAQNMMSSFFGRGAEIAALGKGAFDPVKLAGGIAPGRLA